MRSDSRSHLFLQNCIIKIMEIPHRPSAIPGGKSTETYIQQISGNVGEKTQFLIEELAHNRLPTKDGRTRILDCGVGGGELIDNFKNEYKDPFVDIIAFDIIPQYVKRVTNREYGNVHGVVGDVFDFPFAPESLSAINLSAVIHEMISYGTHESLRDPQTAVRLLLTRLSHSLMHNGVFLYRDIYLPPNHHEDQEVQYHSNFSQFISRYGEAIIGRTHQVFDSELPTISESQEGIALVAGKIHYHRELQRHFITFADFICISLTGTSLKAQIANGEDIEEILQRGFQDEQLLYDWGKREGSETYTYASVEDISGIIDSINEEEESELIIERIETPERVEYSDFLANFSDAPIPDKKQMMLIRKR